MTVLQRCVRLFRLDGLCDGAWLGWLVGLAMLGSGGGVLAQVADENAAEVWVCPPCDLGCHDTNYEEAGVCENEACRKTLIDRNAVRYVAIFVWENAEILDFAGPAEVFATTTAGGKRAFEVYTVGLTLDPIVSQGFIKVTPEFSIENCPRPDIFVLPGGGAMRAMRNPAMIEWVRRTAAECEIAMSVCTGAYVLAGAGLLDGKEATTYHGRIDFLRAVAPMTVVHEDQRFVDNGRVVTSAGVSAGIDASLYLVARLHGIEEAQSTADYMEYDWRPTEAAGLVTKRRTGELAAQSGAGRLTSMQEVLGVLIDGDAEAAIASAAMKPESAVFMQGPAVESQIDALGYRYLTSRDLSTAIEIFRFNVHLFPESFTAHDSLGEGYMEAGERKLARASYAKSLELNPENENASAMLLKLRGN